jgi:hypothetical protein
MKSCFAEKGNLSVNISSYKCQGGGDDVHGTYGTAFAGSFILVSLIKDDKLREIKLWWGNA